MARARRSRARRSNRPHHQELGTERGTKLGVGARRGRTVQSDRSGYAEPPDHDCLHDRFDAAVGQGGGEAEEGDPGQAVL